MFSCLLLIFLQISAVLSNTEKTIFLGPPSLQIPAEHPTLSDLKLQALSPLSSFLRTYINAEFPTNASTHGQASWYLLEGLQEGQRYEVRICWAATQPTSFRMDTYDLPTVFNKPKLITSLAVFTQTRQDLSEEPEPGIASYQTPNQISEVVSSNLLLHVYAAADYYTTNKILMEHVPPVHIDIILDPFILNIFPKSLVPTAGYIIILAIGSWFISKYISEWLITIGQQNINSTKKTS